MADRPMTESEKNTRYINATRRFAEATSWRTYIELAEEFHALDTHSDAAQMYVRCVKAASAPAYREITERMAAQPTPTAAEYREAARIMQLIPDYSDARELMRVYSIRAKALDYAEATALVMNADATPEEIGRAVDIFRAIKGYKDTRELLERYERYYGEKMYAEGVALMESAHVYSAFEDAAEIFERIAYYADAASLAATCRKRAQKLRPKSKKAKATAIPAKTDEVTRTRDAVSTTRVKPAQKAPADETRNQLREVWESLDKRRLVWVILWWALFIADLVFSVSISGSENEWISKYANELRLASTIVAVVTAALGVRDLLRMLTPSMRRKLGKATLRFLARIAKPFVAAVTRVLASIGIDLTRRNRLGGRDERSIVLNDEEKVKKPKKRLKNDLKWAEQTDNAARVRFIFIDYMIRRIREGYRMKRTMTPAEIGHDVTRDEEEQKLFRAYDVARYAGRDGAEEITDALVGELRAIAQKKN